MCHTLDFVVMNWRKVLPKDAIKRLLLGMLVPIFVVIAYKPVVRVPSDLFSSDNSFAAQTLDAQRWWMIGKELFVNIIHYGSWPMSIVLVLFVYSLLVGFDHAERPPQIWLMLLILAQLAGYFSIYLITPHDLDWHLTTSAERVISHLFPMLFFWLFIALQPPTAILPDQGLQTEC